MRGDEVQICEEHLNTTEPFSCTGLVGEDHTDFLILVLDFFGLVLLDEYKFYEDITVLRILYQF